MRNFLFLMLTATAWADVDVAQKAQEWLAPGPDIRLVARGKAPQTTMPMGSLRWTCSTLSGLETPSPRVRVEVTGDSGRRSWIVAFDKQRLVSQKVSIRPLSAGSSLREEDFQISQVWLSGQIQNSPLYDGPYDGRYRLRRQIPANSMVAAGWVEAVPLCESGCHVDVHVYQPGLEMTLSGKALERGYADRPLRVRLDSGGTLQAWFDRNGQLTDRRTP